MPELPDAIWTYLTEFLDDVRLRAFKTRNDKNKEFFQDTRFEVGVWPNFLAPEHPVTADARPELLVLRRILRDAGADLRWALVCFHRHAVSRADITRVAQSSRRGEGAQVRLQG